MRKHLKKNEDILNLDQNYKIFLKSIKERLRTSQIRAALSANKELIKFYWELGSDIIKYQKEYRWGEKFLEQLSHDLRQNSPGMQGFSITNLKRMRLFSQTYPDFVISPQAVGQLPWGHISLLIQKIKNAEIRLWYIQHTIKHGWSRSILEMQIESDLYERQAISAKKVTNYQDVDLEL